MASVKLDWTDGVNGEDHFEIWRSTGSGFGTAPYATAPANATSYTDPAPVVGSNIYKVRGVNAGEFTAFSPNSTAIVPALTGDVTGLTATVLP